jgi:hypothetical protein
MRMIYLTVTAGLCAVASCAWGGVSFREGGVAQKTLPPLPSAAVERTHKTDRMVVAFKGPGAVIPAFSIDVADFLDATVTVRDGSGSILYRVSPTERTTTVAKRAVQTPVLSGSHELSSPPQAAGALREMPDGCESAFSPYVAPRMANVIGRCVSELAGYVQTASAT